MKNTDFLRKIALFCEIKLRNKCMICDSLKDVYIVCLVVDRTIYKRTNIVANSG